MLAFEELDENLDDLRSESEDAANVFKNKMIEMAKAREIKMEANKKIIEDVESQIYSTIIIAGNRLKDVK
jgi:hypothetical protein